MEGAECGIERAIPLPALVAAPLKGEVRIPRAFDRMAASCGERREGATLLESEDVAIDVLTEREMTAKPGRSILYQQQQRVKMVEKVEKQDDEGRQTDSRHAGRLSRTFEQRRAGGSLITVRAASG
jgi:hypothetical protein